eukprot:SAG31_NODE_25768_length_454_cov_1.859155_1_plen_36_part_10
MIAVLCCQNCDPRSLVILIGYMHGDGVNVAGMFYHI